MDSNGEPIGALGHIVAGLFVFGLLALITFPIWYFFGSMLIDFVKESLNGERARRKQRRHEALFGSCESRSSRGSDWSPPSESSQTWDDAYDIYDPYGDQHKAERAKYADTIREYGGVCMEKVCLWPTRRIEAGAFWHLAHDHSRGPHDYLGPAHPECNQAEALDRGVTWEGAPTIDELLQRVAVNSGQWTPFDEKTWDEFWDAQAETDEATTQPARSSSWDGKPAEPFEPDF